MGKLGRSLGFALLFTLLALVAMGIIIIPAAFMPEAFGILWLSGSTLFITIFTCLYLG